MWRKKYTSARRQVRNYINSEDLWHLKQKTYIKTMISMSL